MAAGLGTRMRPLTERWPKPVLPIDGRPVVVTLVHDLARAGCERIVVVTGHLAEQVEALLEPLPYDIRFVREGAGADGAIALHGDERPPLWLVGERVHRFLDPLPGKAPYELQHVFQNASDAGAVVSAIQVGHTRDLTDPVDLMRENFPYLRGTSA